MNGSLQILEVLAGVQQPASLDCLVDNLHWTKSRTYRALRLLQQDGYVDHCGRRGYRLGARAIALGTLVGPRPILRSRVEPVLTWLAKLTSTPVGLHLRSGDHCVLIFKAEPGLNDRHVNAVGERIPLTRGCAGLAVLSRLSDDEVRAVLGRLPASERKPTAEALAAIRRRGFALGTDLDNNSIASAVLDPDLGTPLGAISLLVRGDTACPSIARSLAPPLSAACARLATQISRLIGSETTLRDPATEHRRGRSETDGYELGELAH
ncbi:IclR family transcriptional regulator [uncultured Jatrophihabitans sp.]|uniref:IclR family transcriptional regulator n=1 Tax=uncultured Jatrophihabitans sp. TaxID=1610747 RepID=UPI0035CC4E8E